MNVAVVVAGSSLFLLTPVAYVPEGSCIVIHLRKMESRGEIASMTSWRSQKRWIQPNYKLFHIINKDTSILIELKHCLLFDFYI